MSDDWDREAFVDADDLPPRTERSFRTGRELIVDMVEEHGEEWVLEHYYTKIYPINVVKNVPPKEELPFYDEAEHETMDEDELVEMYSAWAEYRERLRDQG